MPSLSKFIERIDYYCRVVSVGYDWGRRQDLWDGGDTDCSALVIGCLKEAGFDTGNASFTGNMSSELCARGWVRLPPDISTAQPGDILLNDADHVATVLWGNGWDATIGQASIGETGGVYGNKPGDQTGWETNETEIYNYPWNAVLRWQGSEGNDESEDEMTDEQIEKLARAIARENATYVFGDDAKAQYSETGTKGGKWSRTNYNVLRMMLAALSGISTKLDRIVKKLGA